MSLKGIYIDDDAEDLAYADILTVEGSNGIAFTTIKDLPDLIDLRDEILKAKPDIIALDYRLDENKSEHSGNTDFKGGALAQSLREKQDEDMNISCPIILVSNEGKIRDFFKPEKTTHDLFDDYYPKEKINAEIDRITEEIIALANGYDLIQSAISEDQSHLRLFNVAADEWERLSAGDLAEDISNNDIIHVVSRLILKNAIKSTGILLSPDEILARLGVDLSCRPEKVSQLFQIIDDCEIRYDGVFSSGWPRYWSHRFEEWCLDIFDGNRLAISASNKINELNDRFGLELEPEKSRWTNSSDEVFAFICSSCGHPTELKHSLAAYDRYRPSYADGKRVCFACIRNDAYLEKGIRIAKSDQRVKDKIQNGQITPKNAS